MYIILLFVHHIPFLTACSPSRSTIVTRSNVIRHVKRAAVATFPQPHTSLTLPRPRERIGRMLLRLRRFLFTEG
ncbi:hypothetical protein F5141DRAFT_1143906, partial [Pisolithus sp. B1]